MTDEHVHDDADLDALGALAEREARAVERHAATCEFCATRVAAARRVVGSLASTLPAAEPSPALAERLSASIRRPAAASPRTLPTVASRRFAVAAVVALAFAGVGGEALHLNARVAADDRAIEALLDSHFEHTALTPRTTPPVNAKVLFARDGSWLYFVAARSAGALHAVASTRSGPVDLGDLAPIGETECLLARPTEQVTSVRLERGTTIVATAVIHPDSSPLPHP